MEFEAFGLNGISAIDNAGRNMHLVSRIARGACHRQSVREKIPIRGHDIEEAGRFGLHGQRGRYTRFETRRMMMSTSVWKTDSKFLKVSAFESPFFLSIVRTGISLKVKP